MIELQFPVLSESLPVDHATADRTPSPDSVLTPLGIEDLKYLTSSSLSIKASHCSTPWGHLSSQANCSFFPTRGRICIMWLALIKSIPAAMNEMLALTITLRISPRRYITASRILDSLATPLDARDATSRLIEEILSQLASPIHRSDECGASQKDAQP